MTAKGFLETKWPMHGMEECEIDDVYEYMEQYAKQEKIKLLERCKIYLKHPDKNIEGYSYFRIEEELEELKTLNHG